MAHRPATLICTVRNVTHETTPIDMPTKLGYSLCVDKDWFLRDSSQGVMEVPAAGKETRRLLQITPCSSGVLTLPGVTLSHVMSPDRWLEDKSAGTTLTSAQVFNLSQGKVVSVSPSTSVAAR